MVAEYYDSDTLFCFRQTCRWAKDGTNAVFIRDYFETRRVMLQRQSLETLLTICRDPVFGPAVRRLQVTMQHFLNNTELDEDFGRADNVLDGNGVWDSDDEFYPQDKEAYRRGYADQMDLSRMGLDAAYLVSIMWHLPCCTSLEIGGHEAAWGAGSIEKSCGIRLACSIGRELYDTSSKFITRAFHLTLEAICISQLRLQHLSVDMLLATDAVFAFPGLDKVKLRGRFSSITSLQLDLGFNNSGEGPLHVVEFIHMFPSLQEFVLGTPHDDKGNLSRKLGDMVEIPTMQRLKLQRGYWTAGALIRFLIRHRGSLQSVHFNYIFLIGQSSTWALIFRALEKMGTIKYVTMAHCRCNGRAAVVEDLPTHTNFTIGWQR